MQRERSVRVLVTGAAGFLGRHVVTSLRTSGVEVVATDRHRSGVVDTVLDVTNKPEIERVLQERRPDSVVNCAAYGVNFAEQDPQKSVDVNMLGPLALLESAAERDVARFLHVGSCFEYGSRPEPIAETAPLQPFGVYGASKAAATLLLTERARDLAIPLMVARPFGMWGPGEGRHRLMAQIVHACRRRETLDLTPCDVVRDYTYVEDMAGYLTALLMIDDWGSDRVVNLGSGRPVVLKDFVLDVADQLDGVDLMRFGRLPHRPGELASLVADTGAMLRLIGDISETPLSEGVRRTLASQPGSE